MGKSLSIDELDYLNALVAKWCGTPIRSLAQAEVAEKDSCKPNLMQYGQSGNGKTATEAQIVAEGYRWINYPHRRSHGVIRENSMCPDCKGTGKYQGLLVTEDCKACGGTGGKVGEQASLPHHLEDDNPTVNAVPTSKWHWMAVRDACYGYLFSVIYGTPDYSYKFEFGSGPNRLWIIVADSPSGLTEVGWMNVELALRKHGYSYANLPK